MKGLVILILCLFSFNVIAQVETPNDKYLFESDNPLIKKQLKKQIDKAIQSDKISSPDLDFKAPKVNFDKEKNIISGTGGVFAARDGVQVQAEKGSVNLTSNDAEFSKDVLFTWPEGSVLADQVNVNIENEVGTFKDLELNFEDGEYSASSDHMTKKSDFDFDFENVDFTTCHCEDGYKPWKIDCNKANVTVGDYAHTYGTTFDFYGVPLFYTPYFVFPVNVERKTGLLTPEFGYGNQNGYQFSIPLFVALSDSSDLTIKPFVMTETRVGSNFDYRQVFSKKSAVNSRFIFSDESARGDQLRGTNVSDLDEKTFEQQRYGGFLQQRWSNSDQDLPVSFLSDIHLVSDDLFLREFDDEEVGLRNSRFTSSILALRSNLLPNLYTELSAEHNQAITVVDQYPAGQGDDYIFQRYPELKVLGTKNFRPFGSNPLGLKLQTSAAWNSVNFQREIGYDGWRHNLNPKMTVPFRYKNYLNGSLNATMHNTMYNLADSSDPLNPGQSPTDDARNAMLYTLKVGTAIEKASDPSAVMKFITGLGLDNSDNTVKRVKNIIEPQIKYTYIPEVDQSLTPYFDSLDRISETNIVTYGFTSSWIGKFKSLKSGVGELVELTPEVKDLPSISPTGQISNFGVFAPDSITRSDYSGGALREIANFNLRQGYSLLEQSDPNAREFTDVAMGFGVFPSKYFGFQFDSNINAEDSSLSSWRLSNHFRDDRGDVIRIGHSYVDNSLSQLEGSLELVLTGRLRAAYYSRFNETSSDFQENRFAFRFLGGCNCWYVDLGYRELLNPNQEQVLLNFTFQGLGDISQGVSLIRNNEKIAQGN